ncbi:signal peptide peptidase [Actinidia rufa]|uniref:Signal peptide peptidase n=1 Tax=Actinidia rufa TaxID=165716 RepID=A0A7J0EHH9_9ERIC|nr:signal peptide peptidase [Actinidia rufa]
MADVAASGGYYIAMAAGIIVAENLTLTGSIGVVTDKMEEVAQGRVWTGKEAVSRGLVDAIGGFSRAVSIAKYKANIRQDKQVTLVELSRPPSTLPEISRDIGNPLVGGDRTLKELLQELVCRLMEYKPGWMESCFKNSRGASYDAHPLSALIKDYLGSV